MENKSLFIEFMGDSPMVRVLDYLITQREIDFSITDMAENAGIGRATLYRIWDNLIDNEIIMHTRNIGKAKLFKLNMENKKIQKLIDIYDMLTIEELKKQAEKQKIKYQAELKTIQLDQKVLHRDAEKNLSKIETNLKKIADIQTNLKIANLKTRIEVEKVLTPEQKEKLDLLRKYRTDFSRPFYRDRLGRGIYRDGSGRGMRNNFPMYGRGMRGNPPMYGRGMGRGWRNFNRISYNRQFFQNDLMRPRFYKRGMLQEEFLKKQQLFEEKVKKDK